MTSPAWYPPFSTFLRVRVRALSTPFFALARSCTVFSPPPLTRTSLPTRHCFFFQSSFHLGCCLSCTFFSDAPVFPILWLFPFAPLSLVGSTPSFPPGILLRRHTFSGANYFSGAFTAGFVFSLCDTYRLLALAVLLFFFLCPPPPPPRSPLVALFLPVLRCKLPPPSRLTTDTFPFRGRFPPRPCTPPPVSLSPRSRCPPVFLSPQFLFPQPCCLSTPFGKIFSVPVPRDAPVPRIVPLSLPDFWSVLSFGLYSSSFITPVIYHWLLRLFSHPRLSSRCFPGARFVFFAVLPFVNPYLDLPPLFPFLPLSLLPFGLLETVLLGTGVFADQLPPCFSPFLFMRMTMSFRILPCFPFCVHDLCFLVTILTS